MYVRLMSCDVWCCIGFVLIACSFVVMLPHIAMCCAPFTGARISGGGSGGTVVVLCTRDAVARVDALRRALPSSQHLPLIQ